MAVTRIAIDSQHASNRDPEQRPHADRQARGGSVHPPRHASGRHRHPRGAGPRGRLARAGPARRDGHRAAGRPGQIPSRQAQIEAGIPIEVTSETINKVCASSVRAVGMIDQAVRAGDLEVAVGGGMESMTQAPYLLPGRPQRLPHGRHPGAGRDDPGRPAQPVQRQADVRGGDRRSATSSRSPAPTSTSGRCAATSARSPPPTRAASPRRSSRHDHGPQRRHRGRSRRSPAARLHARSAGEAPRPDRQGRHAHRRQLARASTTAPARSCSPPRTGPSATARTSSATIIAQAAVADEFAYLASTPANAAHEGARQGRPAAERHRPVGDQRGVLLRRPELASGCSASTRSA